MDRIILHCDMNNFYASVECLRHPELRGKPVVVGGDEEQRHGIVLAKNYIAKAYGIKTGEALWEARKKCEGLVCIRADFPEYIKVSKLARQIYSRFTDRIESFGIDECWLDITESAKCFGGGEEVASKLRTLIKEELGCTISVGVSWNKIFAKLGSDLKKPDATTLISRENYKSVVYPLPVSELLYVGKATKEKLHKINIRTIGDLAAADPLLLKKRLGKWGAYLLSFAQGIDASPVLMGGEERIVKSVGNSSTAIRDLKTRHDVKMLVTVLAESVSARLRAQGLKGSVVSISVRDNKLSTWGKQRKILRPTFLSTEIIQEAMRLFDENYAFSKPIRSVGVCVACLEPADTPWQQSFFDESKRQKEEALEKALDGLRQRFGHFAINRGTEYFDRDLCGINPKDENVIHPIAYKL